MFDFFNTRTVLELFQEFFFFFFLLKWKFLFFVVVVVLFRAAPVAYRSSQAKGQIGATAAGLHHSHNQARSELCLRSTLQLKARHPLIEARDWTCSLRDTGRLLTLWTTMGTPQMRILLSFKNNLKHPSKYSWSNSYFAWYCAPVSLNTKYPFLFFCILKNCSDTACPIPG